MLTQRFVIFFFGNFWLAYGNNSPQANLSSAEGLLWASDVQEATQRAQDEGDFVRCPGHLGFSPWSFTKSAGFIHLLWPILSQTFVWVLRTTTNNCRVIFIDFRIVPLPHTKTEILQDSYCGAMKEPGLPVVPVIVLTSFDATITSLCPHSKFLRWDLLGI